MSHPSPPHAIDPASRCAFREALLGWYEAHRRDLPWRRTDDPYAVWVAEVMSQQTRVETVLPYYRRWLERFPDVNALAAAPEEEVLRLWQGLGYYSRARNLHRAARRVVEDHGGDLPADPEHLRALPGVGDYTAGAVASIAFGRAAPAVDGNVRRVLARLADAEAPRPASLRTWAGDLVDPHRPGDFNQALMELGSRVCTPRSPDCGACPVARYCSARARGTQERRPASRRKPRVRPMEVAVAAVAVVPGEGSGGLRLALRRRPSEGLLGGMWELPGEEVDDPSEAEARARRLAGEVVSALGPRDSERQGPPEASPEGLAPVDHAFSHRRARYHPFLFLVASALAEPTPPEESGLHLARERAAAGRSAPDGVRLVAPGELPGLPLPVAQRKVLEALARSPSLRGELSRS